MENIGLVLRLQVQHLCTLHLDKCSPLANPEWPPPTARISELTTTLLQTLHTNTKLLSEQLYTQQHNKVCKVIYWHICKNFNIPVPENS